MKNILALDPETIAQLFGRDAVISPPHSTEPVEKDGLYLVYEYETVAK